MSEPFYSASDIDRVLQQLSDGILIKVREHMAERRMHDEEMFLQYTSSQIWALQTLKQLMERGMYEYASQLIDDMIKILEPLE